MFPTCGFHNLQLLEIERRNSESSTIADAKLKAAHDEMVLLRDQNDELSTQVESMREKVKTLKAFQEKRSTVTNKRRKGSTGGGGGSKSLTLDGYGSVGAVEVDEGTDNEYPLEKMGKFHLGDVSMFSDGKLASLSNIKSGMFLCVPCSNPIKNNQPFQSATNLKSNSNYRSGRVGDVSGLLWQSTGFWHISSRTFPNHCELFYAMSLFLSCLLLSYIQPWVGSVSWISEYKHVVC